MHYPGPMESSRSSLVLSRQAGNAASMNAGVRQSTARRGAMASAVASCGAVSSEMAQLTEGNGLSARTESVTLIRQNPLETVERKMCLCQHDHRERTR